MDYRKEGNGFTFTSSVNITTNEVVCIAEGLESLVINPRLEGDLEKWDSFIPFGKVVKVTTKKGKRLFFAKREGLLEIFSDEKYFFMLPDGSKNDIGLFIGYEEDFISLWENP